MSTELESSLGFVPKPSVSWVQIWRTSITRPTVSAYQDLLPLESAATGDAWLWLFGSSLISGLLISLAPYFTESAPLSPGLAFAIPGFAIIAVLVWAIFAGFTHMTARLFQGTGAYSNLIYLFAASCAPLMLLASVLSLVSRNGLLLAGLYLYWLVLYITTTQVVYRFSRIKAVISTLIALLLSAVLLGGVLVGLGLWLLA